MQRLMLAIGISTLAAPMASADDQPPNVIFIMADDLGYGDLGCFGQARIKTPRLDRMAAEGRRFTRVYAGSTVCAPSRCALMTGYHTGHARVRGNAPVPLRPEDLTVAEVLKAAGYRTALYGKWGLGNTGTTGVPTRQGFDEFYGYLNQVHAHNSYPDFLWRDESEEPIAGNRIGETRGVSVETGHHSHDLITAEALGFLDRSAEADGPFFLYIAYTIPHANNERGRVEGNGMEIGSDAPYSDESWPAPQKNHAAMITALDRSVGQLLDKLAELGIDEQTLVIFTSDNGPHKEGGADPAFFDSNGPLRGYKRDLYEGGIRVPTIARWPGQVPAGSSSELAWAFWDVLPTLAGLAGAEVPESLHLDGIDVSGALLGAENPPTHDYLYWEFHEGGFTQAALEGEGRWKSVRAGLNGPIELYDLASDEGETTDVAADHPEIVEAFEAYYRSARTDSHEFPVKSGPNRPRAALDPK